MINYCKECNKRVVGCHDTCETYKAYRDVMDELAAAKQKRMASEYRSVAAIRNIKRKMYKGHRDINGGERR